MIEAILFDLDGTLLPMDQDVFVEAYFGRLAKKMVPHGFEPKSLIQNVWTGTREMIKNDGSQTNEDVFWGLFSKIYGKDVLQKLPVFEDFYRVEFQEVQASCGYNPKAREVVETLKNKYRLILATNPIFPSIATYSRIRWAGLDANDFEWITTYENSHSCKPNPVYYQEILERIGLKPENCLMVGNDVGEDMVAEKLGCKVFLLTDDLINAKNVDISKYPQGSFDELLKYIETL